MTIAVNGYAFTGHRNWLVAVLSQYDGIARLRGIHSLLQCAILSIADLGGDCQLAVKHKGAEMLHIQHRAAILHSEAGIVQISLTGTTI